MDDFFSRFVCSNEPRYWFLRHLVFWVACWAFMGLVYGFIFLNDSFVGSFHFSFMQSLFFLPQHIFLSYGIIYWVLPNYILRNQYWVGMSATVLLIMIAAGISPLTQALMIEPYLRSHASSFNPKPLFFSFLGGLRGSMTVAGFATAIKLIKHWHFKRIENEFLEKEKIRAELELLKDQLHPHFMFNALNSIYSLALKNSPTTPDAILKLSNLMRYLVTECNEPMIALSKEIEVLRSYIEIEKNRFGNQLDLSIQIDGVQNDQRIAPLLLLPLVENSFKHGAYPKEGPAWMSLDLRVDSNMLMFKLINGKASSPNVSKRSSGIGLQNVKQRLNMMYPNLHNFRITEDEDMFTVSLSVRLQSTPNRHESAMLAG